VGNKKYITRLTPNENNWVKPSGKNCKCQGLNLFEASINDYGHEEWLNSKAECFVYNGWHYGYIQAFSAIEHINNSYNLTFFTKRCVKNTIQLSIVGTCKGVISIDEDEARTFFDERPEVIETMKKDLKAVHANYTLFQCLFDKNPRNIINVKFKPEDLNFYEQEKIVSVNELPDNLVRGNLRFRLYEIKNNN
jgi:hypothetical protein